MNYKKSFSRSINLCRTCKVKYNCLKQLIIIRKIVNNQQFMQLDEGHQKQPNTSHFRFSFCIIRIHNMKSEYKTTFCKI